MTHFRNRIVGLEMEPEQLDWAIVNLSPVGTVEGA